MNRWQRYYQKNRERLVAYQREYRATGRHKEAQRKARAKWKRTEAGKQAERQLLSKYRYGITLEERQAMYDKQNGLCGLCHQPMTYAESHLDHNHETDDIRSLLHPMCNLLLGMIEKNPELAPLALSYLEQHKKS